MNNKEYFEIWKYCSERADQLQDKLWTIGTWIIAIAIGLLAFIFKELLLRNILNFDWINFILIAVFSGFIFIIAEFLSKVIQDFEGHIKENWKRATIIKLKINTLKEIYSDGKPDDKENPKATEILSTISITLKRISFGLFIIALVLFILNQFNCI